MKGRGARRGGGGGGRGGRGGRGRGGGQVQEVDVEKKHNTIFLVIS